MEAGKTVKMEGKKNDLLERIAADPMFGLTIDELNAIMEPKNFVGRAPQQTEEYINGYVKPVIEENKELIEESGEAVRV